MLAPRQPGVARGGGAVGAVADVAAAAVDERLQRQRVSWSAVVVDVVRRAGLMKAVKPSFTSLPAAMSVVVTGDDQRRRDLVFCGEHEQRLAEAAASTAPLWPCAAEPVTGFDGTVAPPV